MEINNRKRPWADQGYVETALLPDGRAAALVRTLFGGAIIIGPTNAAEAYDEEYMYPRFGLAYAEWLRWDGRGEPARWIRARVAGRPTRRRTAGNPAREYIAE